MKIEKFIDIEEVIRASLSEYMTVYVRPLPKDFTIPSILITAVGGNESDKIDAFDITVDSRAEEEIDAMENLQKAVGIIEGIAKSQETDLRHVTINTLFSWGTDPVRKDLAMCTARLRCYAHKDTMEVNKL